MQNSKNHMLEKVGFVLVLLMGLIQFFYALYAFIDPVGFSSLRGTPLIDVESSDWVIIYASRTLFIALIIGLLLYLRNYKVLAWAALFGSIMPITDAILAYQDMAADKVVFKHVATLIYLLFTFFILFLVIRRKGQ